MKKGLGFFALGVGFAWGFWMIVSSVQFPTQIEQASLGPSSLRDPAAIRRMYDYSNLQGSALQTALQHRLVDGARIVAENGNVGLELGHFVVQDASGDKVFACQKYSKMVLSFEAEGIAVAGEKPTMELEGVCQMADNINSIAPLWIPVARVLGEPVMDGELDYRDAQPVKLRFAHVVDAWPKRWALKSVRLISEGGEVIDVSQGTLRDRLGSDKPLILSF